MEDGYYKQVVFFGSAEDNLARLFAVRDEKAKLSRFCERVDTDWRSA